MLDCGGSIGLFSRAALAAGASRVIVFEPAPPSVECLRRNLSKEIEQGRVIVVAKGVWNKEDWLEMHFDLDNHAAHSFIRSYSGHTRKIRLPLTTIDSAVNELGLDRVDFIKMDIEGAERQAVEGARATLARFHPRLAMSVYHLPDDPKDIPAAIKAAWPRYQYICGPCEAFAGSLNPQVFFFY